MLTFVTTGLSTGGAEANLYRLLMQMDRTHFQPSVISLTNMGTWGEPIANLGVPVHTLNQSRGAISPTAFIKLIGFLRRSRPSLIQGWMYHGNLAATASLLFLPGRPKMIWGIRQSIAGISDESRLTKATIYAGAALSFIPHKIVYNARASATQHASIGYRTDRAIVIPNGFDCEKFGHINQDRPLRQQLNIPADHIVIGHLARYHPMKDHLNFLLAIAKTLHNVPNIHAVLAGKQVDWNNPALTTIITELGIGANVHLLGERHDIPEFISELDLLCSSSAYNEGFPTVVGEAMAGRVPCVVTDVGDAAWVVGDTGRVVPPGNADALAHELEALLSLNKTDRLALGLQARRRVLELFSLESVVSKYESMYQTALQCN